MITNSKIVLAAALVLGSASAALANDVDVNPSEGQAMREMHGNPLPWWWNAPVQGRGSVANAGDAFGYFASPTRPDDLSHKKSHSR
jgi:hypothetical protein